METGGSLLENKEKEQDFKSIQSLNQNLKKLQIEFVGFLNKHTVYETVPENTKVNNILKNFEKFYF